MRMMNIIIGLAALFAAGGAQAADTVVMRINFTPWAMHAQYYGGLAQDIYKAEGIELEIRPPSAGQQNEVFIGTGREQFGVANADSFIKARASGVPVVGPPGPCHRWQTNCFLSSSSKKPILYKLCMADNSSCANPRPTTGFIICCPSCNGP